MRHVHLVAAIAVGALASAFAGCGGGAADDPRCKSLCVIEEPSIEGAGDICSQASADLCREDCGARIEGVGSACASCLLEEARFSAESETGVGGPCDDSPECPESGLCTESGPGGDCDYCGDDAAAELACYKKAHPRREVECKADFRDPKDCSDLCAGGE